MILTEQEMASIREDFETARTIYPPESSPEQFMELLFDAVIINIDQITDRWFADLRTRIDQEAKNILIDEVKQLPIVVQPKEEVADVVPLPEWDD